ncbi:MAG: HlyD family efflux transporter periplasmic adaptor subunit [Oscillospiraceae bacterium]|nr:HlyD family efflux transporter periplasmic adaptor subunit [Oscillospiraceae bacterium]
MSAKGIVKGIVTAAVIGGLGFGGWMLYRNYGNQGTGRSEKVYVQKVATVNTVGGANLFATNYAGMIVAQKTVDVKYDTTKTVDDVLVHEGDAVKKGDKLLTYNVESIQLEIDAAKLEVERLQNQIKTNELEIGTLEQEKRNANGDAQVSYTTRILALQSDNARSEYDIKAKNVEITKLENTLNNAFVTAPIDGTVKELKEISMSSGSENYQENADVVMKIAAEGEYRVKGLFNEQNASGIYEGAKVYLRSRVDDTVRKGEINEIDTNPQTDNNNMYYGYSDDQTTSSKYAFYVKPESLEGFMLGQHLIIEMDTGQESEHPKDGIWIYSSFVLWDGDDNYVWAKNSRDQIEKRVVKVGDVDDEHGDCQILSGLEIDDYIAYPADYIEAGMATTTNQSDKDIPENVLGGDMGMDMPDGGMEGGGYAEEADYDEDGNMVYQDEEGNVYKFDAEGNLIEGGEDLFGEDGENAANDPEAEQAGDGEAAEADAEPQAAEEKPEN